MKVKIEANKSFTDVITGLEHGLFIFNVIQYMEHVLITPLGDNIWTVFTGTGRYTQEELGFQRQLKDQNSSAVLILGLGAETLTETIYRHRPGEITGIRDLVLYVSGYNKFDYHLQIMSSISKISVLLCRRSVCL